MSLVNKLIYLRKFPFSIVLRKAINQFRDVKKYKDYKSLLFSKDLRVSTGSNTIQNLIPQVPCNDLDTQFADNFVQKKINILGSGSLPISFNTSNDLVIDSNGDWLKNIVDQVHLPFSVKLWNIIQDLNRKYVPIDWQKDHKSGYSWSAKKWFRDQGINTSKKEGIDIKIPWELSRLQHLPVLILTGNQTGDKKYSIEAITQLLDFMMANPVGMGVNFNCPMDIGIRNANILVAVDWLKSGPLAAVLTNKIESIIARYIECSTNHILIDIEYREGLTSNHYLGNVLGVLFSGAYLTDSEDSDKWLAFGIQELERSMKRQFFDDGSNFEGSTSYHRLSGEMMAWGAALILSVPKNRFQALEHLDVKFWKCNAPILKSFIKNFLKNEFILSDSFWIKLIRASQFSERISKSNGEIPQFGDNDSGRFIRITTFGAWIPFEKALAKYQNLKLYQKNEQPDSLFFDENHLNHGAFISSVCGLMAFKPNNSKILHAAFEYDLFKKVSSIRSGFYNYITHLGTKNDSLSYQTTYKQKINLTHMSNKRFEFKDNDVDFTNELETIVFQDFQLVVFKNKNLHLAIAGISNPNSHHSLGHTHNDKLSVELTVNDNTILFNPGTYVYSPYPEMRRQFRSVKSHNTISVNGQEQNTPLPGDLGLFNLKFETSFKLLHLTSNKFIGQVTYRDVIHIREISIEKDAISITDHCNKPFENHWNLGDVYSNGYGQLIALTKK